jgi:hypothetical protein
MSPDVQVWSSHMKHAPADFCLVRVFACSGEHRRFMAVWTLVYSQGWLATESSRAFRAAAESFAPKAPRTPPAPGTVDAPMALSRSRWLRAGCPRLGSDEQAVAIRAKPSRLFRKYGCTVNSLSGRKRLSKCRSPHANCCVPREPPHSGLFTASGRLAQSRAKVRTTGNWLSCIGSGTLGVGVKWQAGGKEREVLPANFVDTVGFGTAL